MPTPTGQIMRHAGALLATSIILLGPSRSPAATTESILFSFNGGSEGGQPSGITVDTDGNIWGFNANGGVDGFFGGGTMFELNPRGNLRTIYGFANADGIDPSVDQSPATKRFRIFYGTTYQFGPVADGGTLFSITASGTETTLHAFDNGNDGANPTGALALDPDGSVYGTTPVGGSARHGVLYKYAATGAFSVLHSFSGSNDGGSPDGVVRNKEVLYGVAEAGGVDGHGIVYKFSAGIFTILHAFTGGGDGGTPQGKLLVLKDGTIYGATAAGGGHQCGLIYKLTTQGRETVLHAFAAGGVDGCMPNGGLVRDTSGNLYGTTAKGGDAGSASDGEVFKISSDGSFSILHTFTGAGGDGDGSYPLTGPVLDQDGNLYGTTIYGGTKRENGTIYKIAQ